MAARFGGNTYRPGGGPGGAPRGRDDDYDPYAYSPRYDGRPSNSRNGSSSTGLPRPPPPEPSSRPSSSSGSSRRPAPNATTTTTTTMSRETDAERQIANVLDRVRQEWPSMLDDDCVPVVLGLQLLDSSSVGRAHDYKKFRQTHDFLQRSLKSIVHEHHQGFNSSIGTFHKIQSSIQTSQKRVRSLKESLAGAGTSLCSADPELNKLSAASQAYDEVLLLLNEIEELRLVPDRLEARISEKRFLTAVGLLQGALRRMRRPELDEIGALADLRSYLANQESALEDILVEELHEHLYLKSPYCQDRWHSLAAARNHAAAAPDVVPFYHILDSLDSLDHGGDRPEKDDPSRNPEADTFSYIGILVEALNRLGRLQNAVDTLKQRLPVELFAVVSETTAEVDNRHLKTLRSAPATRRTTQTEVIHDLLRTLYAKFEAIAEGQRVFHESVKALIRREGAGNNSALLGTFKELWHLYQNEIRSLLHNYVTTDADVYRFATSPHAGSLQRDPSNLFKLSDADAKAPEMVVEMEALEGIIRSAVPGLTSRKGGAVAAADSKKVVIGRDPESAVNGGGGGVPNAGPKSLVEPSVFNMSLLLPPTLSFLQRLRGIVPPGSDLATSTLTTFLDNFLVNVFQPQLDETLGKLSDSIFAEPDSFLQDQDWTRAARRPVLKGATAFFDVVTAFCRMLGTIPHDQALSSLIVTQMNRYYERCLGWYESLVSSSRNNDKNKNRNSRRNTDTKNNNKDGVRDSARMVEEMHGRLQQIWESPDPALLDQEVKVLVAFATSARPEAGDAPDQDMISSLCLLYTSLNWLSVKISGLRHITHQEADSSRPSAARVPSRRWTLVNDPGRLDSGPVMLPLTNETVQTFDTIVASYKDLAVTALLTLHMEARCQIGHALAVALSPETAPYLLDQEVTEPDPQILSLNSDLVAFDETISRFLRPAEASFIRTGLARLVNAILIAGAPRASPMNARGCRRMRLNILVLQQNLKNIEDGAVALARADEYYALFEQGPDAIVDKAKSAGGGGGGSGDEGLERFSYDELKALLDLFYSEPLANPERGIASAAKRQLDDKALSLNEVMWQG